MSDKTMTIKEHPLMKQIVLTQMPIKHCREGDAVRFDEHGSEWKVLPEATADRTRIKFIASAYEAVETIPNDRLVWLVERKEV